jgi:methylated-DNA-[protein]-cysteine S-methyltransferase
MRSYAIFETELGWVGVMRTDDGLSASTLPRLTPLGAIQSLGTQAGDRDVGESDFTEAVHFVRTLLSGRPCRHDLPLDLSGGTVFQQSVWSAVGSVPFGCTRSYGWVAHTIGRPLAAHAVGQAISSNAVPLFIPCHRIIAANGDLGGYGPGVEALPAKRSLLRREGTHFAGPTLEQIRGVTAGEV